MSDQAMEHSPRKKDAPLEHQASLPDQHTAPADAHASDLVSVRLDRHVQPARPQHLDALQTHEMRDALTRQEPVLVYVAAERTGRAARRRIFADAQPRPEHPAVDVLRTGSPFGCKRE